MLRNLGIRWQILSALALPVLILGLISGRLTYQALLDMRQANQSSQLAQSGRRFGVLINGLSAERALSQDVPADAPGARAQLKVTRAGVDQDLRSIRSQIYTDDYADADVRRLLDHLAAVHAGIPALRHQVDSGKARPKAIAEQYSQVIAADVNLPSDLAETVSDPGQAANFRAAGLLDTALEALAQEQITGSAAIGAGRLSIADQRELGTDQDTAQRALTEFRRIAKTDQSSALDSAFAAPGARSDDLAKARTALQRAGTGTRPAVRAGAWSAATKGQIQAVRGVLNLLSSDSVEQATADYTAARKKVQFTLGGAVGVTALTLLLALGLSRRISAPLRRLTLAATAIRDELPRLVENLQADREHQFDQFGLALPAVSTVGNNEVSRLAAAFVGVNAVTVQVARKQARLRAAVGDMFVNVARRNQVLLARQLAFIDQLERTEADPQSLQDLFRLDHLATRMRRNAESLLVLAGMESGRRLREPMPLSDVVRTATSQIEHYPRVTLSLDVDPQVNAHLALPIAHLLAELLENATNFSDPATSVMVAAGVTPQGLRIIVTDQGLGMSPAELNDVRARIGQSPTAETLSSQRLGFFVVGQLAQRLDAQVSLSSERARGTAVAIDLPPSVFVSSGMDDGGHRPPAARPARATVTQMPDPVPDPTPDPLGSEPFGSDPLVAEPFGSEPLVAEPLVAEPVNPVPVSVTFEPVSASASAVDALPAQAGEPFVTPQPVAAGAGASAGAFTSLPAGSVPKPLPMPGPMPIPASLEMAALTEVAQEAPTWVPESGLPQAASGVPLARRVPGSELRTDDGAGHPEDGDEPHGYLAHRGHQLHHDHEHHFHSLGPPPPPLAPGEELRMRTLLGAVDVLPVSRTSLRTALRKGRRARDVALGRTPSDGFDPTGAAREYALREGFIDQAMTERGEQAASADTSVASSAYSAADEMAELGGPSAYQPESVAGVTPAGLRRRSPNPTPSAQEQVQAQAPQQGTARPRSAGGVRAMLSGFRSGVERGRTSPAANRAVTEREPGGQPPDDGHGPRS